MAASTAWVGKGEKMVLCQLLPQVLMCLLWGVPDSLLSMSPSVMVIDATRTFSDKNGKMGPQP